MRPPILFACLLFSVLLPVGCSQYPTAFSTDKVSTHVGETGISVFNKSGTSVYYFAVERELAARINWAAVSSKENEITSWDVKFVAYADIGGFEREKQILLYYWSAEDPSLKDIQNMVINTDD